MSNVLRMQELQCLDCPKDHLSNEMWLSSRLQYLKSSGALFDEVQHVLLHEFEHEVDSSLPSKCFLQVHHERAAQPAKHLDFALNASDDFFVVLEVLEFLDGDCI